MATNSLFPAVAINGGSAGALDAIDGNLISDGDGAIVVDRSTGKLYAYTMDAASGATESYPDVIAPDLNAGDKRWILHTAYMEATTNSPGVPDTLVRTNSDGNIQDLVTKSIQDLASQGPFYWFDGDSGHIALTAGKDVGLGRGDATFLFWSDSQNLIEGKPQTLLENKDSSSSERYSFKVKDTGELTAVLTDGVDTAEVVGSTIFGGESDVSVVGFTVDRSVENAVKLSLDGLSDGSSSISDSLINTNFQIDGVQAIVGSNYSTDDDFFDGGIHRVTCFNFAISDEERKSFSAGKTIPYKYLGATQDELVQDNQFVRFVGTTDQSDGDVLLRDLLEESGSADWEVVSDAPSGSDYSLRYVQESSPVSADDHALLIRVPYMWGSKYTVKFSAKADAASSLDVAYGDGSSDTVTLSSTWEDFTLYVTATEDTNALQFNFGTDEISKNITKVSITRSKTVGTFVLKWVPEADYSALSSGNFGLITLDDSATVGIYADSSGNIRFNDGRYEVQHAVNWSAGDQVSMAVVLDGESVNFGVSLNGNATQWGVSDSIGIWSNDTHLRLAFDNPFPQWFKRVVSYDKAISAATLEGYLENTTFDIFSSLVFAAPFNSDVRELLSGQEFTVTRDSELTYLGSDDQQHTAGINEAAIGKYGLYSEESQAADSSGNGVQVLISSLHSAAQESLSAPNAKGTHLFTWNPEFSSADISTGYHGLIAFDFNYDNGLYFDYYGQLTFTDGIDTATISTDWVIGDEFKIAITYGDGQLELSASKNGTYLGTSVRGFTGSLNIGTDLAYMYDNEYPQWCSGHLIYNEKFTRSRIIRYHQNILFCAALKDDIREVISGRYANFKRPGKLVILDDGAYKTVDPGLPALGTYGLFSDGDGDQYFDNPDSPVTQTITLPIGTFTLWVEGDGSADLAANTATISATGTVTENNSITFDVTAAGTVDVSITDTLQWCQLESGILPTSRMYYDSYTVNQTTQSDFSDGTLVDSFADSDGSLKLTFGGDFTTSDGDDFLTKDSEQFVANGV